MPTLSGLRRRGFTPEAIRSFCARIGVAKRDSIVDVALLEHAVREDLNKRAPRAMAVLRPVRLVLENYPEGQVEEMEAVNNPEDPAMGTRRVPFSRVLYIERDDFREDPRRSTTASRPAPRCGSATPTWSAAPAWSRTPRPAR
jgi:glutaminyl-tRNA synthetase